MNLNRKGMSTIAIVSALMIGGLGGSLIHAARAADASSTASLDSSTTTPVQPSNIDQSKGGHVGANGVKEELLTGDTAEKVKAAALEAVPGGTILRVETDAEGATYEAHMTKSDGSQVTVFFDANYKVTGTETGMGMPKSQATTNSTTNS